MSFSVCNRDCGTYVEPNLSCDPPADHNFPLQVPKTCKVLPGILYSVSENAGVIGIATYHRSCDTTYAHRRIGWKHKENAVKQSWKDEFGMKLLSINTQSAG